MQQPVFFQPAGAWVGDVIPWQEHGEFSLFYLHEVRRSPKPGTPWHLVTTTDFVHFDDEGRALGAGDTDAPDFNAYTGSIVRDADGVHHLFYTGQNPRRLGPDGLPLQLVMHATSVDGMATWQRHPEHTFGAPAGYEPADWRDPFVFRDEEAGLWRMLVAARHVDGPERRRGVIAQCVSRDLVSWEPADPFWDPRRYITHECPEVFRLGRLVVPRLLRVLGVVHDPIPDVAQPPRPVAGAAARLARRTRLLRGEVRRARRSPILLRLDREPRGRPRRRRVAVGRHALGARGPRRTPTARSRSASPPSSWRASPTTSPCGSSTRVRSPGRRQAATATRDRSARRPRRLPRRDLAGGCPAHLPRRRDRSTSPPAPPSAACSCARATTATRATSSASSRSAAAWSSTAGRVGAPATEQWEVSGDVPFVVELERPCDLAARRAHARGDRRRRPLRRDLDGRDQPQHPHLRPPVRSAGCLRRRGRRRRERMPRAHPSRDGAGRRTVGAGAIAAASVTT